MCDVCRGNRYNRETLAVKYKGLSIADLLDTTIEDALPILENIPQIKQKLETLLDVGLGYIKIGQSSTTLSGGEAQRIKLAKELSKRATGKTIYILDEPTTGLHFADVHKLLEVLQKLVDTGNTVIVIEHHLDVIKSADYVIDLGPEGGSGGGKVVASGTPEEIVRVRKSYTGQALKSVL
jgi:excinuclease ABC subunit A